MYYTATDRKRWGVLRFNKKKYGITSNYTNGSTQYITKCMAYFCNESSVNSTAARIGLTEASTFGKRSNISGSTAGSIGPDGVATTGIAHGGSTSNWAYSSYNYTSIAQSAKIDWRKTSGDDYVYVLIGLNESSSTSRRFASLSEASSHSKPHYVELYYVQ